MLDVEIKLLSDIAKQIGPPTYGGGEDNDYGNAGLDLYYGYSDPVLIRPGEHVVIGTGIALHIRDEKYVGVVAPRSGLGFKKGLVLRNTIGVIDSNYMGEIKLALRNTGNEHITINPGDRVAQMMLIRIEHANLVPVEQFSYVSGRGEKGFGSSGVSSA